MLLLFTLESPDIRALLCYGSYKCISSENSSIKQVTNSRKDRGRMKKTKYCFTDAELMHAQTVELA